MFSKVLSLCALALSGVAYAAAQGISPGRYTIGSSLVFESSRNAQVRNSSNILVVPGNAPFPVFPGSDEWELAPGQSGGLTMQSVAFGSFLTVDSHDKPIVTTGTRDQATSFAITSAGSGQFHINVVAQDLLWAIPASVGQVQNLMTPDGTPVVTADAVAIRSHDTNSDLAASFESGVTSGFLLYSRLAWTIGLAASNWFGLALTGHLRWQALPHLGHGRGRVTVLRSPGLCGPSPGLGCPVGSGVSDGGCAALAVL
ncbi:hypothetical protein BD779DRAFT_1478891 [Infundibulicybe gibba]|nr:hypothetical protein BD779DRAFT_1478891 [Infundibulicybe gibba]